jgi:hypothetical protein
MLTEHRSSEIGLNLAHKLSFPMETCAACSVEPEAADGNGIASWFVKGNDGVRGASLSARVFMARIPVRL